MEKKTIGSFLAVLRKANGMTQEEVAQQLYVSNKTVSKWERDESCPDLSLIPVLAEMFHVTSDELLRGERMKKEQPEEDHISGKTEQQVKRILRYTLSRFTALTCVAAVLTLLGLICLFVVAYTYYKPLLGFGLFLALALSSILLEVFQYLKAGTALAEAGLPEADGILCPAKYTTHRLAFGLYLLNACALIFALPLGLTTEYVTDRTLYLSGYLPLWIYADYVPGLVLESLVIAAGAVCILRRWLGTQAAGSFLRYTTARIRRFTMQQAGWFLGIILFVFMIPLSIFLTGRFSIVAAIAGAVLFVVCILGALLQITTFARKSKERMERWLLVTAGIRNALYLFALFPITSFVTFKEETGSSAAQIAFHWNLLLPVILKIACITGLYFLAKYFLVKGFGKGKKAEQQTV